MSYGILAKKSLCDSCSLAMALLGYRLRYAGYDGHSVSHFHTFTQ